MTRAQIRSQARSRADQDSSTFPTDTQYNEFIDQACKEVFYDLVRAGWPISFTQASAAVTTSFAALSTVFSVAVPVAFVHGVYCYFGGEYYELKRVQEGDRAALYSTTGTSMPTHYDVRIDPTNGIGVETLPFVSGVTIKVDYVKEHPGLASDSTTWFGPARSDELVIVRSAAKGCRKEGNDQGAAQLDREYEYLKQCVQDLASWTNLRHSALIRDVRDPLGRSRLPGDFDVYGPDY